MFENHIVEDGYIVKEERVGCFTVGVQCLSLALGWSVIFDCGLLICKLQT